MSTPKKHRTTGSKPSEIAVALCDLVAEQPGLDADSLIGKALARATSATAKQARKALANLVHSSKKLEARGPRGSATYYLRGTIAKAAAAPVIAKREAGKPAVAKAAAAPVIAKRETGKPAVAKKPACAKSQTAGDDEFSIMLSESGKIYVTTDEATVILTKERAERLHRFIGRINMDAPA